MGREVSVDGEPERIVTLAPSLTEIVYFLGLLIALACSFIESSSARNEPAERKVTELLDQALAKPAMDPGEPYPSYSAHTMENDTWHTSCASIKAFRDLRWKCAVCDGVNLFTQQKVVLRGTRMRFVVRCYLCGKHSVIRVSGLVNCRLITEARVPDFQGQSAAVLPDASLGGRSGDRP